MEIQKQPLFRVVRMEDEELSSEEKAAKSVIIDIFKGKVSPQDVLDDVEKLFLGEPTKDARISKIVPFRVLSKEEEKEFRQWAQDHFNPRVTPSLFWHPVVRDEWEKLKQAREKWIKAHNGAAFPGESEEGEESSDYEPNNEERKD